MSIVPFVHLPIKEYRLKKDPRPRLDIEYLADYQSSESDEGSEVDEALVSMWNVHTILNEIDLTWITVDFKFVLLSSFLCDLYWYCFSTTSYNSSSQNYTFSSDSSSEDEKEVKEDRNDDDDEDRDHDEDSEGSGQSQSYDEYDDDDGVDVTYDDGSDENFPPDEGDVSNSYYTIDDIDTLSDEDGKWLH